MSDVKSTQVQALDKEPQQVLQTGILGGRARVAQFVVDLTDATQNDNIYLIDLPVNAVLLEMFLFQDAADTTNFDIGDSNSADAILDGQAINQDKAVRAGRNNTTGTNGLSAPDFHKQLWEVLGYSSRVAAGRSIRLTATAPSSNPGDNKLYGYITYVVD